MKIILIQHLVYISRKETKVKCYTINFHSNIKPCIGDLIELPTFNGRTQVSKVKQVHLKFNQNMCQVFLEDIITNVLSDMNDYSYVVINEGWDEESLQ